MRDSARAVSADVLETTPGGTHQARLERDVRVQLTERRLAALQVGEAGLVFGRTDASDGDRRYIGRLAISDEDNEPLVVDWRAPAAEPFYRATPGRADGPRPPPPLHPPGPHPHRPRRRAAHRRAHRRRPGPGGRGGAAGRPRTLAVGADGRHRGHHPAGAGRDRPLAPGRHRRRPGGTGDGQDGRRPPPGRLPALHVPLPAGAGRGAAHRPQPHLPALHRAGPARPGRAHGQPGHPRRPGAHARPGRRHPRGGPAQGRGPHGHRSSPRPWSTGNGACPSPSACCGTASACACRCATPVASWSRSGAGGAPTTSGGRRWSGRWCATSWAS